MTTRGLLLTLALTAAGVTACDSDSPAPPPPAEPPPPPAQTVFSDFVVEQFNNTADDTDPVAVDDVDFAFDDQDNPDAFDDLLSSNP